MNIAPSVTLYKPENLKYEFLSNYTEKTAYTYSFVFEKSYLMEETLGKDLYDFTASEIIQVLKSAGYSTINSVQRDFWVIDKYISYAAKCGKINSAIKVTSGIDNDILDSCVDKTNKVLWSESEINGIVDKLINYQDKAMIMALFEGISGNDTGFTELLYLKKSDVHDAHWAGNKDKKIRLYNGKLGKERRIEVSEKTASLLRSAALEDTYILKNGESNTLYGDEKPLTASKFIFRIVHTGRSEKLHPETSAPSLMVTRRFTAFNNWFNIKNFTAKNVRNSGMLKMAKDLYKRDGELGRDQYIEIAEQFGIQKTNVGGNMTYVFSPLKRFLTIENIEKFYPEEF
ncbi:site-specific integrase [Priestia flexa]|uniref:phage lytic cycle repressor MrpR family protein n=1 Tax=Priestia flexa TaxID=86664 RepID=UPI0004733B42|nr:site-specific integrase [Priestia flexa]